MFAWFLMIFPFSLLSRAEQHGGEGLTHRCARGAFAFLSLFDRMGEELRALH
jgi:hypothetical protein